VLRRIRAVVGSAADALEKLHRLNQVLRCSPRRIASAIASSSRPGTSRTKISDRAGQPLYVLLAEVEQDQLSVPRQSSNSAGAGKCSERAERALSGGCCGSRDHAVGPRPGDMRYH
jgi:hypothetical protein